MIEIKRVKTESFSMEYFTFGEGENAFDTAPDYKERLLDFAKK